MPLIKSTLKAEIQAKITSDAQFKKRLYDVSFDAMEKFQIVQKTSFQALGTAANFPLVRKAASTAFAFEMQNINRVIAEAVADAVSDSVDAYIKQATVKVTVPPGLLTQGASTAAIPNPAPVPLIGTPPATGGIS